MKKWINLHTLTAFLFGALLFSALPIKAAIDEYLCYKADYKVIINGQEYTDSDLPILNYKGNTYAPFRSILEKAGLEVNWNAALNQAEVTNPKNTFVSSHALIEVLGKKYPLKRINLNHEGVLNFGDTSFKLPLNDKGDVDVSPLVEAGILTKWDI